MVADVTKERLVILGCGGHARVLLAALALLGRYPVGCLSPRPPEAGWPDTIELLGGDDRLATLDPCRVTLVNGRGSIGSTEGRRRLFQSGKAEGFNFADVVHPAAHVAAGVELGEGVQIMAGAILQNGTRLGADVIVNTGAVIDHDCTVSAHCHIATGARLSGGVVLGEGVHVGTGAAIIQGIVVGKGAVVGAGAVVVHDVAANVTVAGVPARLIARRNNGDSVSQGCHET
jgi:UDP-perosamine 4-acetyltransferase